MREFDETRDGWEYGHREFILVGPPGTGKTRQVLDAFMLPALADGVPPRALLACSFTKAAAIEMRARAAHATDYTDDELRVTFRTIHSEAYRVVRSRDRVGLWTGGSATLKKKMVPDDDANDGSEIEIECGWEKMNKPCSELRDEAVRLWDLARHTQIWIARTRDARERAIACVMGTTRSAFSLDAIVAEVGRYEGEKAGCQQVDFTDMLLRALDFPAPSREMILVDEAQDLSPLQVALIRHWAEKAERLVWVGDPDQGIYAFAGADGYYLTEMMETVEVASLQQSWRVPQAAHALARRLILLNQMREDAPYLPADRPGSMTRFFEEVEALRAAKGASKTFVLSRTVRGLAIWAEILTKSGEPFVNERGASPWKQRVACEFLLGLYDLATTGETTKERAKRIVDEQPGVPRGQWFTTTKTACKEAVKDIENPTRQALQDAGLKLGWLGEDPFLSLEKRAEEYESHRLIVKHHGWNALDDEPSICLTTIHGSKGREANTVIVDLTSSVGVRREMARDPKLKEEERRVLYVALTRTEDRLLLFAPHENLAQDLGLWL